MPQGQEIVYRSRDKRPLLDRIDRAIKHYQKRNLHGPNYCLFHPLMMADMEDIDRLRIKKFLEDKGITGITADRMPMHCVVLGYIWEDNKELKS